MRQVSQLGRKSKGLHNCLCILNCPVTGYGKQKPYCEQASRSGKAHVSLWQKALNCLSLWKQALLPEEHLCMPLKNWGTFALRFWTAAEQGRHPLLSWISPHVRKPRECYTSRRRYFQSFKGTGKCFLAMSSYISPVSYKQNREPRCYWLLLCHIF